MVLGGYSSLKFRECLGVPVAQIWKDARSTGVPQGVKTSVTKIYNSGLAMAQW